MRIPKVYVETSIFNFVFADDAPDKMQDTLRFFEEVREGKYEPYTSNYVLQELLLAEEPKRNQMVRIIETYNMVFLPSNGEAERLADMYVSEGIVPARYVSDAVHIATATVNDLDFIVSYNFRHIVKRKTIIMTEGVNLREGYKRIGIYSPTEVIEHVE